MAIKGKGKARRRTVASGPKPVYVEPPKPPWRRRWVQLTALAVVVAGIGVGVAAALIHIGNVHHKEQVATRKAKEAAIVGQFGSQVDQALTAVSQQFRDSRQPFPELTQSTGNVKPDQAFAPHDVAVFRASVKLAGNASTVIGKIPTATLISGHPKLLPLIDSQNDLVSSIEIYQEAASALVAANTASGDPRAALISQGKSLVQTASKLFSRGYQKLINARAELGIPPPQQPPPTRASPTASPSASASASPKPTQSPKKKSTKK